MENTKIDILNFSDQIVFENYDNNFRKFYTITDLAPDELKKYDSFMDLVKLKTSEPYDQIYISNFPLKRFVNIADEGIKIKEILYSDMENTERDIFDSFYDLFTNTSK
jgi:hypothetical protein